MKTLLPRNQQGRLHAVTQQTDLSGTVRYVAVSTAPAMRL